ncbi:hypothetical protein TRFO_12361 [Tritrichomonas foetus]|uniref:HEAT repeat family protein n=1 Tax=Tritrichomonas foetus TaxID=1144522 RepID=A0A1J4L1K9_9EUKA|nr:hypothetical protein TRFO_12361 [Tritrichomonas foetus]|eukprot:OHT17407.1 hypothetical protein TRFO_12361 [Tritrichomonas foetus]
MNQAKNVSQSFDLLVANHNKLNGSKTESMEVACETVFASFTKDPSSILGPICEQITRTTKKSRRMPYLNVAQWLHEKGTTDFDKFISSSISGFLEDSSLKRQVMGCCVIIRILAISSCGKSIINPLIDIIQTFTSSQASLFEMEIFNTTLFLLSVLAITDVKLQLCVSRFAIWMKNVHQISSVSSRELLKILKENSGDYSYVKFIPLIRSDIPPSLDKCRDIWARIVPSPFSSPIDWIELGIVLGRFEDEKIREQIASLSTEQGQFSSILTVALSAQNESIQNVARALFRFGVHGKETAAFDPHSLSQILEQSDDLTEIAITFLSEMALANAKECVPQLFPLLQSDKPSARKNSLELLSRILKGNLKPSIRQMIATSLLPLVGDDAITVRVDIPKLFVSVSPTFIVPPLIRLLSDKDERKRSTASSSISLILKETKSPDVLLDTILNCTLGGVAQQIKSPADISANTSDTKAAERAMKLVEQWANESKNKIMLDPSPVLERFWKNPSNEIYVSFIAKSAPLYDQARLLAAIIEKIKKNSTELFDRLAPLLVLRSQSVSFFMTREVSASPLFSLLFHNDETEEKAFRNLRCELLSRFSPSFVMPQLIEYGIMNKFSLCIICYSGQTHPDMLPLPYVVDEIENNILQVENELFIPFCDAFYFSDRKRFINFAINQNGSHRGIMMLNSAVRKFTPQDCNHMISSGILEKILAMKFQPEEEQIAIELLFVFSFQCKDVGLGSYWENMFDIASHYSDSSKPNVRFAALKLIGAILSNPAAESHLLGAVERIQHIVSLAADDQANPQIRALANELNKVFNPSSLVTELPQ